MELDIDDLKSIFCADLECGSDVLRYDLIEHNEHPVDDLHGLLKKLKDDYEWAGNRPFPVFVKKESAK